MKLFLIKTNKVKYKAAQRVLSFKKKTSLTVMNMHSNLLNSRSVHRPLSVGGMNLQPNFQKGGGSLTEPQFLEWIYWERGGDFIQVEGLQFSHKNKSKYQNLNI